MRRLGRLRRLRRFFDNPTKGIEYNQFSDNTGVSRRIYDVDIARNPRVVKDSKGPHGYLFIDVQEDADKVNGEQSLVNAQRNMLEWSR